MASFTLNVSTVKTAYDYYLLNLQTLISAQAALDSIGSRPANYPIEVIVSNSWNFLIDQQDFWDSEYAMQYPPVLAAKPVLRTAELVVLAQLGYNSGATNGIVYNQWVKLVGTGGGYLTYTVWVGFSQESTYLTIITSEPTQNFPNY